MNSVVSAFPFALSMFVGMIICLEIGRHLGQRALVKDPQLMSNHSAVDSAVFALYGLLLAFTFSGAPNRLDTRRKLIAEEANAISTAYSRIDLLATELQPAIREHFRQYLDSRISAYNKFPDVNAASAELTRSNQIQEIIWSEAVTATRHSANHPESGKLLLPALNEMANVTTMRTLATRLHPPTIIYGLLFLIALVCSLLAGYGMAISKERSWLHILAFTSVAVITIFVVLEIEYPRMGILHVQVQYDALLIELRQRMN